MRWSLLPLKDPRTRRTLLGVATPMTTDASPPRSSSPREQRLERLFAEHGRAVWAYARRRASAADADEVVSETFLVAWRRLDDVPGEARPWLLGVARRCLANVDRGQARQTALRQRLASERPPSAPDGAGPVLAALARLSPGDREVLTLLTWDDLAPAEIAAVLGCTRTAVYLRLHRARRRLAALLAPIRPDLTSVEDE
jgi:RNA polymerase sigma-70 factor (ECF subfamily)